MPGELSLEDQRNRITSHARKTERAGAQPIGQVPGQGCYEDHHDRFHRKQQPGGTTGQPEYLHQVEGDQESNEELAGVTNERHSRA